MKWIKRILLYTLVFILTTIVIFSIGLQINFESYITTQKRKYGILKDKKRVSYLPVIFYFGKRVFYSGPILDRQIDPYYGVSGSYISHGGKDEYMVDCYFTEEEKISLKEKYLRKYPLTKTDVLVLQNRDSYKYNNDYIYKYGDKYFINTKSTYIHNLLSSVMVYKSEGPITYTLEELETDSLFFKSISLPGYRVIEKKDSIIIDGGVVMPITEINSDSIFCKNEKRLTIYIIRNQ